MQLKALLPTPSRHRWLAEQTGVASDRPRKRRKRTLGCRGWSLKPGKTKPFSHRNHRPPPQRRPPCLRHRQDSQERRRRCARRLWMGRVCWIRPPPRPAEAKANEAPGTNPPARPLIPLQLSGTGTAPALAPPETSAAVKPVEPIMGSAPSISSAEDAASSWPCPC